MKQKIIFPLILLVLLSGCTIYQRHMYDAPKVSVLQGELTITMAGTYDEAKLLWGAPYYIQFWFNIPTEVGLTKIRIQNISLIGEQSSNRIDLPDIESHKIRSRDSTPGYLTTVASVRFAPEPFEYESFRLYATIAVYNEDSVNFSEKVINTLLKINSSKERHWNWFDKKMSV